MFFIFRNFHYINDKLTTVMCICTENYPNQSAFEFLKEILFAFNEMFPEIIIQKAHTYSLNSKFNPILKAKFKEYNSTVDFKKVSKINELKDNFVEVKNNLIQASLTLDERSVEMSTMLKKADALKDNAVSFFHKTKTYKQKMEGNEYKKYIFFAMKVLIIISLIYFLSSFICGGFLLENCIQYK